ncbi:MAG: amidohydrolase [Planctomycetota bacterium]
MNRLLLKSARRYPSSDAGLEDLLIDSGKVVQWIPSGSENPSVDQVVDLEGRWVLPGFVDSHLHLLYTEQHSRQISLAEKSLNRCITDLKAAAREGGSLIGHGWRDPLPAEMLPTPAAFLDRHFPDKAVLLWNADFHRVLVSPVILAQLGKDPGHSGVLVEEEAEAAWNCVKESPAKEVPAACQRLLRNGITAATTFDRGESIRAFHANPPGNEGVFIRHGLPEEDFLSMDPAEALPYGDREDSFAVRWVKIFADGTLGSRTAWLKSGYTDDPENLGIARRSGDSLLSTAENAGSKGWGLAIHAIGDAAVCESIRAIHSARMARAAGLDVIDRIEHLQLLDPGDAPSLIQSGAVASLQPCHLFEDRTIVRGRWGKRADYAIPFRYLLDQGVPVVTGTDAPIEDLDPWADLFAACERLDRHGNGEVEGPDQRVLFSEAFHSKTAGAAKANFLPEDYGTLNPGSRADFQVLETDPETVRHGSEAGLVEVFSHGQWRLNEGRVF